jgi:hypothetical protein
MQPVGCKSRCLISLELFSSLVMRKQNSFSLLARAARSSISFFRGPTRASSRERFWLGKELGLWLGQVVGSKSNKKELEQALVLQ